MRLLSTDVVRNGGGRTWTNRHQVNKSKCRTVKDASIDPRLLRAAQSNMVYTKQLTFQPYSKIVAVKQVIYFGEEL